MFKLQKAMCGKLFTFKEQVQLYAHILKEGCNGKGNILISLQSIPWKLKDVH